MSATKLLTDLRAAGLHVVEEPGWKTRGWSWKVDGEPEGVMQHHTAPPNPYPIKKLYGPPFYWIKANMATHEDGTLYMVAYKACNYSSGIGMKSVLVDNVRKSIAPTHNATKWGIQGGNKYFWNIENSHPGDGSSIPQVQLDTIIVATQVVIDHFRMDPEQVISHAEWTSRKVDPKWNGSNRFAIEQIREGVSGTPSQGGEEEMLPLRPSSPREDIRSLQGRLNTAFGAGLKEDTVWGKFTENAVKKYLLDFTGSDEAGDKDVINGVKVNARMWNGLLEGVIRAHTASGGGSVAADLAAHEARTHAAHHN